MKMFLYQLWDRVLFMLFIVAAAFPFCLLGVGAYYFIDHIVHNW